MQEEGEMLVFSVSLLLCAVCGDRFGAIIAAFLAKKTPSPSVGLAAGMGCSVDNEV
jgi:hypothetical protein